MVILKSLGVARKSWLWSERGETHLLLLPSCRHSAYDRVALPLHTHLDDVASIVTTLVLDLIVKPVDHRHRGPARPGSDVCLQHLSGRKSPLTNIRLKLLDKVSEISLT